MRVSDLRRAAVAAATVALLSFSTTFADSVSADGDIVAPDDQSVIDLGSALPGADVGYDVYYVLRCDGQSHVDHDQMVRLAPSLRSVPPGGAFSVGTLMFPIPATWPADGDDCPATPAPFVAGPLHVVVTAPPDLGENYHYTFSWSRTLVPTKDTDPGTFSGLNPSITFVLDVVDNTPPTLHLPADSTIEGSEVGGAPAAYTVTADDVEDATDPTPSCDPAVGDHLPLGKTTVECSVTDGGGLTTEGSFDITVVDTTAPVFANVADITVDTGDPTGRAVDYGSPSLREVVDPSPTAGCSPASGSTFPVGTTTVRCTATDGSGNTGRMSFDVTVRYVPLVVWSAVWGEPVAAGGGTFVANLGRSVPVKVDLLRDGVRQTAGTARLAVTSCAGGPVATSIELTSDGGRWSGKLDTGAIGATGCYLATATLDGQVAGSFRITLRGADGAPVKGVKAGQP